MTRRLTPKEKARLFDLLVTRTVEIDCIEDNKTGTTIRGTDHELANYVSEVMRVKGIEND